MLTKSFVSVYLNIFSSSKHHQTWENRLFPFHLIRSPLHQIWMHLFLSPSIKGRCIYLHHMLVQHSPHINCGSISLFTSHFCIKCKCISLPTLNVVASLSLSLSLHQTNRINNSEIYQFLLSPFISCQIEINSCFNSLFEFIDFRLNFVWILEMTHFIPYNIQENFFFYF